MRVALTGAPMAAFLDDAPLRWHGCHLILPGQALRIGGVGSGASPNMKLLDTGLNVDAEEG